MALRNIRTDEDPILRKKSKVIDKINERVLQLRNDMFDTMYDAEGVGLAAPQVGILKRIVVIDIGEGPITLINPQIVSSEGEEIDSEGCLSLPGKSAKVKRPIKVKVSAFDIDGKKIELVGEGLLARAICHELDHLDGVLFIDRAEK